MKQTIKKAKLYTPLELARILGVEKEYREILFEQELKKNHDIIMDENNSIDNINENERIK